MCAEALTKWPAKKIICSHCKQPVFVRTHPWSREKVLCSEAERQEIDSEWTRFHDSGLGSLPSRVRAEQGKFSPQQYEARLIAEIEDAHRKHNWGLYFIVRSFLNELKALGGYGKENVAEDIGMLHFLLNGPRNNELATPEHRRSGKYPDFKPKLDDPLPPAIIARIDYAIHVFGLMPESLEPIYLSKSSEINKTTGAPLDPAKTWEIVRQKLFSQARRA